MSSEESFNTGIVACFDSVLQQDVSHEQLKGALYIILQNQLLVKNNWDLQVNIQQHGKSMIDCKMKFRRPTP